MKTGLDLTTKRPIEVEHIRRLEKALAFAEFRVEAFKVLANINDPEIKKAAFEALRDYYDPEHSTQQREETDVARQRFQEIMAHDYTIDSGPGGYTLKVPEL